MDKGLFLVTVNQLKEIADILYKGESTRGIAAIQDVIPNIAVISDDIEDEGVKDKLLNEALAPMLAAMQENDGVTLADIITYELIELLETL